MVYVAALNKARRAKSVDPSISSLANKFSFVCSGDASYVTGQTINVDGGARMD